MWIPRISSTPLQASIVNAASWSTRVWDIQGVEKIVSADLCLKTSGTIFRTACLGDRGWSGSWLSSVVIACVFHECMSFLSKLM